MKFTLLTAKNLRENTDDAILLDMNKLGFFFTETVYRT